MRGVQPGTFLATNNILFGVSDLLPMSIRFYHSKAMILTSTPAGGNNQITLSMTFQTYPFPFPSASQYGPSLSLYLNFNHNLKAHATSTDSNACAYVVRL